jgi:hypothetical protein
MALTAAALLGKHLKTLALSLRQIDLGALHIKQAMYATYIGFQAARLSRLAA